VGGAPAPAARARASAPALAALTPNSSAPPLRSAIRSPLGSRRAERGEMREARRGEARRTRSTDDRLAQSEPSSSYLILRLGPAPAQRRFRRALSTRRGSRSPSRCPMRRGTRLRPRACR
jgi:hypothetical protein